MQLENVQNWSINDQNLPKNFENKANRPKKSKKCVIYCKNSTHNKKCETCTQNPTAGPQTYWEAPSQLPTQFAPLDMSVSKLGCRKYLL